MTVDRRGVGSAAIYARISSDQGGLGLGVQRQLEDCRRLAADRGWVVGDEYVDNDVSAYSGKPRAEYSRMVADLRAGVRDAVIVYNLDRLHRRPVELEDFVALCEQAGVRDVATVTADIDLGNDDGLFMARIFAAFAAKESGRRSARVRRKMEQNAAAGLPHGGALRPFGYAEDRTSIVEDEAAAIREVVSRYCAGESLRALTVWLTEQGVQTVTGGPWRSVTLRELIASPRIAGLREHRGEVVGEAIWQGIITGEQRERVLAVMASRSRSGKRAPRSYLLTGMLRCGRCGNTLFSMRRQERNGSVRRRYVCLSGPDHGGCGKMTVVAEPVEELISESVLVRLDSPDLAAALAGRLAADADLAAVADALGADEARLTDLAGLYAEGAVSVKEWMTARDPIQDRIKRHHRRLAQAEDTGPIHALVGHGEELRSRWAPLSLDRRQAIVRSVLDHAVIAPGARGANTFDVNRVAAHWRV